MDPAIFVVIALAACAVLCALLWRWNGRSPVVGAIFGVIFGPFALAYGLLSRP